MPEGDTVFRAARALERLVGDTVVVEALHPRARVTGIAPRIDGRRLTGVRTHGKQLLLEFEGDVVVRNHLGMTGSWRVLPLAAPVFGQPWLVLRGARDQAVLRGGSRLVVVRRAAPALGPDILARPVDCDAIAKRLRRGDPKRPVGDALLDQRLVAGIGNIWRSEALWAAGVSPISPLAAVTDGDLARVIERAAVLMRASAEGRRPAPQVYRRSGRPCARCGAAVVSAPIGAYARVAYWCPRCQRGKEPVGT